MIILYVMRSVAHFHYHKTTIEHLCNNGHTILGLFDKKWSADSSDAAVRNFQSKTDAFKFDWLMRRNDIWRLPLLGVRELINYVRYLRIQGQSPYYLDRWKKYFPRPIRHILRLSITKKILATDLVHNCLQFFKNMAPPDYKIIKWLEKNQFDVVVASPVNLRFSSEVEYIKAANTLNIPTVIPVFSWDNLTTKGLFHAIPDMTLVWNHKQLEEAVDFNAIPNDKIIITGSPFFDQWFQTMQTSQNYESFCKQVGIEPNKPFIVYLGSSANIAPDETWLVEELAECLRNSSRPMNVLVRPHPANADIYKKISAPNITVWPREGTLPDTIDAFQTFHNTLQHCVCAVGLNTSGMIDAVISDTPCITIMPDCYSMTQSQVIHFRHLLEADVLEVAKSSSESADLIHLILQGRDSKKEMRQLFINEYVRPRGIERPAGWVVAKTIEMVAAGLSKNQIDAFLDSKKDE